MSGNSLATLPYVHSRAMREKTGGRALRDSEAVRGNPGLCLEPECIDPAEPGWGDFTAGRGLMPVWELWQRGWACSIWEG